MIYFFKFLFLLNLKIFFVLGNAVEIDQAFMQENGIEISSINQLIFEYFEKQKNLYLIENLKKMMGAGNAILSARQDRSSFDLLDFSEIISDSFDFRSISEVPFAKKSVEDFFILRKKFFHLQEKWIFARMKMLQLPLEHEKREEILLLFKNHYNSLISLFMESMVLYYFKKNLSEFSLKNPMDFLRKKEEQDRKEFNVFNSWSRRKKRFIKRRKKKLIIFKNCLEKSIFSLKEKFENENFFDKNHPLQDENFIYFSELISEDSKSDDSKRFHSLEEIYQTLKEKTYNFYIEVDSLKKSYYQEKIFYFYRLSYQKKMTKKFSELVFEKGINFLSNETNEKIKFILELNRLLHDRIEKISKILSLEKTKVEFFIKNSSELSQGFDESDYFQIFETSSYYLNKKELSSLWKISFSNYFNDILKILEKIEDSEINLIQKEFEFINNLFNMNLFVSEFSFYFKKKYSTDFFIILSYFFHSIYSLKKEIIEIELSSLKEILIPSIGNTFFLINKNIKKIISLNKLIDKKIKDFEEMLGFYNDDCSFLDQFKSKNYISLLDFF